MEFQRGIMLVARPGDRIAGVAAMPHAFAVNPVEMDATSDDRAATDEPPAAEIDVRATPGLGRVLQIDWIAVNLHRAVTHLAKREHADIARLNVLIVDDARMSSLHEKHSGDATTTDVLTFDLRDGGALQAVEADIVVCADEAARRAAELNHPVERELLLYCVHGMLHCLGYDDHDAENWQRMHAVEDEILKAIGVGAVFNASPPATPKEDQR